MSQRDERWAIAIQDAVTALRKERALTLKQLSARSGLSESYLSEIEHHRKEPTGATIAQLANGFDLSLGQFVEYIARTLRQQTLDGHEHYPHSTPMSVELILSRGSANDIMELSRFADYLDWKRRVRR